MELKIYLQYMRRGWWIILLTTLVAINVAFLAIYFVQPIYEASARFIVSPNKGIIINENDLVDSLGTLDDTIVTTYTEVLSSPTIFSQTSETLALSPDEAKQYVVSVATLPDTNIIELIVDGPNPELVAAIANKNGAFAIDYMNRVYPVYQISFLDSATLPSTPIKPQPIRDIGIALGMGLVAGMILAIVREQLQVTIETLRGRSRFDNLSGALSRAAFLRELQTELSDNPLNPLSLILIKLNGLDDIISVMPRSVEHKIMQQVSQILREQLRGNDIISRWDRTTFAVSLPNTTGKIASKIFGRVFDYLNFSMHAVEDDENLTIALDPHIGITTCNGNEPIQDVTERAQDALDQSFTTEQKVVLVNLAAFV